MKKFLMKLLGIEPADKKLARLEANHVVNKESIDRVQNSLDRLVKIHAEYVGDDDHKQKIAEHIELVKSKLKAARATYAENEILLNLIRNTLEAEKGIYA